MVLIHSSFMAILNLYICGMWMEGQTFLLIFFSVLVTLLQLVTVGIHHYAENQLLACIWYHHASGFVFMGREEDGTQR